VHGHAQRTVTLFPLLRANFFGEHGFLDGWSGRLLDATPASTPSEDELGALIYSIFDPRINLLTSILVSGSAGYIGSHMACALRRNCSPKVDVDRVAPERQNAPIAHHRSPASGRNGGGRRTAVYGVIGLANTVIKVSSRTLFFLPRKTSSVFT
jgi:hypothetical protein